MDILSLAELGETERRLLAIFVQFGRDGRALTTQSLAAIAGMAVDSKRLATALNNLAARGLIERGGGDPLPGSPIAFRLSRPMSRREGIEAIRHWRDPTPLGQIGRRDKPMPRNRVPAERPMHERGTPSSPCSHWLSVEPLTPPTRLTGRRACNSPGCRGLRPYVFWGGRSCSYHCCGRAETPIRVSCGSARYQVGLTGCIASHHQTAVLAAPHIKDDHIVSSRPLDRGMRQ
jgi:hypothetical protein